GLEPVAPFGHVLATLADHEREFAALVGHHDHGLRRPTRGPVLVRALEARTYRGTGRSVDPLGAMSFGAPLPHALHIRDQLVQLLRRSAHLNGRLSLRTLFHG